METLEIVYLLQLTFPAFLLLPEQCSYGMIALAIIAIIAIMIAIVAIIATMIAIIAIIAIMIAILAIIALVLLERNVPGKRIIALVLLRGSLSTGPCQSLVPRRCVRARVSE